MQLYVVATSGPFYKKQRIFGERHICHISGLRYFMLMARAENYRHAHIQFQIIESNPNEYIPLEPSCINVYRSEVVTRGVFSTPATHLMAHHLSISISPPRRLSFLSLSLYLPTYLHAPTCTYLYLPTYLLSGLSASPLLRSRSSTDVDVPPQLPSGVVPPLYGVQRRGGGLPASLWSTRGQSRPPHCFEPEPEGRLCMGSSCALRSTARPPAIGSSSSLTRET